MKIDQQKELIAKIVAKRINGEYFSCKRHADQVAREIAESIIKEIRSIT